jgi:hypothetical protein
MTTRVSSTDAILADVHDATAHTLKMSATVTVDEVEINNAAGAAAVNIQDGGNSITVDGTVAVTGAYPVTQPVSVASAQVASGAIASGAVASGAIVDGANVALGATSDAAVDGDAAGSVNAHLRGISKKLAGSVAVTLATAPASAEGIADDAGFTVAASKVLPFGAMADETSPDSVDEGDIGAVRMTLDRQMRVFSGPYPQAPLAYRSNVVAADVLALPASATCTKIAGAGLTAATYYVKILAINQYGRTTAVAGNTSITTESTNLRINAAFAQVAGATHYGIYCSAAADPLWSGRITEAQRAAGVLLSTLGAGSATNSVDIDVIGTGLAASTAASNYAASIPASPISCVGFSYLDVDVICSRTGDAVAPALVWAPFFLNTSDNLYTQGQAITMSFGGAASAYGSMRQRYRIEVRGNSAVALVVQSIAGTGMSVNFITTLN